jgi:hypothetical protein
MADLTQPFAYDRMRDASKQIRLFSFVTSAESDRPSISLQLFEIQQAPPYVALSYAWGKAKKRRITVNGRYLLVRPNCKYALRQLRRQRLATWYWVDAICINQTDDFEKGPQVSLMGAIFGDAHQVAVSYGGDTIDSEWLMRTMYTIWDANKPEDAEFMAASVLDSWWKKAMPCLLYHIRGTEFRMSYGQRLYKSLVWISEQRYWTRLWIVQEIVLSRECVILSSSRNIRLSVFTAFARALSELLSYHASNQSNDRASYSILGRHYICATKPEAGYQSLDDYPIEPPPWDVEFGWQEAAEWPSALDVFLLDFLPMFDLAKILRAHEPIEGVKTRVRHSLTTLLGQCRNLDCFEKRDRVYALLSIARWPMGEPLLADYTISLVELAKRLLHPPTHKDTTVFRAIQDLRIDVHDATVKALIADRMDCSHVDYSAQCVSQYLLDESLLRSVSPVAPARYDIPVSIIDAFTLDEHSPSDRTTSSGWILSRFIRGRDPSHVGTSGIDCTQRNSTPRPIFAHMARSGSAEFENPATMQGHACIAARTSDILLQCELGDSVANLVLRASQSKNLYSIIGSATLTTIIPPHMSTTRHTLDGNHGRGDSASFRFVVSFDFDDLVTMVCLRDSRTKPSSQCDGKRDTEAEQTLASTVAICGRPWSSYARLVQVEEPRGAGRRRRPA